MATTNSEVTPPVAFFTSNCACSPWNFCLLHYGKLLPGEKAAVRRQQGIR
jgi:hypothetical protein